MNVRTFTATLITLLLPLHTPCASAMTMKQISDFCHSSSGECIDNPMMQVYVGGALDLLGTLDEQTDYLGKVYCKKRKEIFDVPAIIRYMESHSEQYASDNAMLVLVRYFEEFGGCNHE